MTFETIIKKINSLPPLSDAAKFVQSMYESGADNIKIPRLVRVIESDAMLTANILRMINTPLYGLRNKITSIAQAVSLLGTQRIQMLVIYYAMTENLKADTSIYGFNHAQFNELCQLQSTLMLQWYGHIDIKDAKFLASLALIMESGKLILAQEVTESDYIGEFRKGFNECENIDEYEKLTIDTTSCTLSSILFEHWNLDPLYIEIMNNLTASDEEIEKLDPKVRTYINHVDIVRTVINAKEILSDNSIAKASAKVDNIGENVATFQTLVYKLRDDYLES